MLPVSTCHAMHYGAKWLILLTPDFSALARSTPRRLLTPHSWLLTLDCWLLTLNARLPSYPHALDPRLSLNRYRRNQRDIKSNPIKKTLNLWDIKREIELNQSIEIKQTIYLSIISIYQPSYRSIYSCKHIDQYQAYQDINLFIH